MPKNLFRYLEELNISSGIRRIEIALSTLYNLNNILEKENLEDFNDIKVLKRQFSYVRDNLLSAAGFLDLYEYTGNIITGNTIKEKIDNATVLLNDILSSYNDGTDDAITWGKTCMDIAATLSDEARKI